MSRVRAATAILLAALILAGVVIAGVGAAQLLAARGGNMAILALASGHDVRADQDEAPLIQVARARALIGRGAIQAAQALADSLANAKRDIGGPLHYAIGNALMRHAFELMRKMPFWKVKTGIAQAKSEYRQAIQADAGDWDARYNYAIASSFLRDSEQAQPTAGEGMAHERAAWPDIPGAPNGLP